MRVRKAVIPAAGLGTRSLPVTKSIPKEMLPVVDVPVIQIIVAEAIASGVEDIVLVTSSGKTAIEDHFDVSFELEENLRRRGKDQLLEMLHSIPALSRVVSVRQPRPLGLGHAVLCARAAVDGEPFAVLLPDDIIEAPRPCLAQLLDAADERTAVVALERVPEDKTHLYGIVDGIPEGERRYRVRSIVEKPAPHAAPSQLAVPGRYVLPPDIFEILEMLPPGHGGEIQLTDALAVLAHQGRLRGVEFEGRRYDTGDRLGYLEITLVHALRRPELAPGLRALLRRLLEQEEEPR
jgi:UTP--glucose-1-phosphate uridylyltransferase